MGRARPRCPGPGCGHLADDHTIANSRYANWGIGCMTAGCRCPAHNWTEPARPDYVIKPWALMQIRHMAQTVQRAVAAGEGMFAAGEIDKRSALDLRRGYVAAVDLVAGFTHLANTGLLIEASDSRLLAVEESMFDRPRRRRPAV